ncbi:hypothetical protein [Paenibacillus sp. WLX2291]|uniref:hypothetical protein n=1 Tax=Paenibacillus sp. WLX2291 TaxID=3296934 RepID=UPI003984225A
MEPQDVVKIVSKYLSSNLKVESNEDDILESVNQYLLERASLTITQQYNNYPSKTMRLLVAYYSGIEQFKEELENIHEQAKKELESRMTSTEYCKSSVLKDILNRREKNINLESIAAFVSLNRAHALLLNQIKETFFYSPLFENSIHFYCNLLFDVDILVGGAIRRTQKHANLEIFSLAKNMINYTFNYQMPVVESSIFLLRQSIEVQVKLSLGLTGLKLDTDGLEEKDSRLTISNLLHFLKEKWHQKKIGLFIDPDMLITINRWLNNYIHNGKMNYPFFYIEWIQDYLNDFFYPMSLIKEIDKDFNTDLLKTIFIDKSYIEQLNNDLNCLEISQSKPEEKDFKLDFKDPMLYIVEQKKIINIRSKVYELKHKKYNLYE